MKVKIFPTCDTKTLEETLNSRFQKAEIKEDVIELEIEQEKLDQLERTPGIERIENGEDGFEGIGGKPVKQKAYARLESEEDAVKALLATLEGYSLVIFDTDREWDLKQLRRYNPDIIQLKNSQPVEKLDIKHAVGDIDGCKNIQVEFDPKDVPEIYSKMLT